MKNDWKVFGLLAAVVMTGAVATAQDTDGDNVSNAIENAVPSHFLSSIQPNGDGNNDNVLDSTQNRVISFRNGATVGDYANQFITITAPALQTLRFIAAIPGHDPLLETPPLNVDFPVGIASWQAENVPAPPALTTFRMRLQTPLVAYFGDYYMDPASPSVVTSPYLFWAFPIAPSNVGANASGNDQDIDIVILNRVAGGGTNLRSTGDRNFNVGNPGRIHHIGGPARSLPLSITLDFFRATATAEGVTLSWATVSEENNAGFNIYRSIGDGDKVLVNSSLIPSTTTDGSGASYSFVDSLAAVAGEDRMYWIQDVELGGVAKLRGPYFISEKPTSAVTNWFNLE
jgi:hypothetical protein